MPVAAGDRGPCPGQNHGRSPSIPRRGPTGRVGLHRPCLTQLRVAETGAGFLFLYKAAVGVTQRHRQEVQLPALFLNLFYFFFF